MAFKVLDEICRSALETQNRTKIVVKKRVSVSVLKWWSDPPQSTAACVSLSYQQCQRAGPQKLSLLNPCRVRFPLKASATGARCLVRAVFEVNRLFPVFQQRVQSGEFSFENLPAMRLVSPMINWKNECLPGAVQIRFGSEPSRRGARCLGRAHFEVNRRFQCLCSECHPFDFLSKTAR